MIAWPSSVNEAKLGSCSSTSRISSTTVASLSWNSSKGRYHSRSQCVCGTTKKRLSVPRSLTRAAYPRALGHRIPGALPTAGSNDTRELGRVLITGAAGDIGSCLREGLRPLAETLVLTDVRPLE